MTKKNEPKNEVQVWTPSEFAGSDLLPMSVTPESNAVVAVEGVPVVGSENIEQDDLILPQLSLLQGMSDAVTSEQGPEKAKPGRFLHTLTQEVYEPPLRVLLVYHWKSRAMFPKDNDPRFAGVEPCLSRDGKVGTVYGACAECDYTEWGENRQPPMCSEAHNFVAMTDSGPAVLRFSRTSYKAARKFLSAFTMAQAMGKNIWAHPCIVTVKSAQKMVQGKNVTYYMMEPAWQVGESVPPDWHRAAYALYQQVKTAHESGALGAQEPEEKRASPKQNFDDVPY